MSTKVELVNVTKRFGDIVAVDDVSLQVMKQVFLATWTSGCGKTTLRIIAGLEEMNEETMKIACTST